MQLRAFEGKTLIYAYQARKGTDYRCPDCKGKLRLRGGRMQQLHFFHPYPRVVCAQHKKSLIHLNVQKYLFKSFKGSFMEYYFPKLNRFADIVIPESKLIFEVQCSQISLVEVRARQEAYRQTGFELVWILHDKTFNKRQLSESESYLRNFPCYYTNIDDRRRGIIYDQHAIYSDVKRLYIGKKCPIWINKPLYPSQKSLIEHPDFLEKRRQQWPVYFKNDLLDRVFHNAELAKSLIKKEKEITGFTYRLKKTYKRIRSLLFEPTDSMLTNLIMRM